MKRFTSFDEIEALCEAMIRDFFRSKHYTNVQCVDIEGFVRDYLGVLVVYETFAEPDPGRIGFLSDGVRPLAVKRGDRVEKIVFPPRTAVIEKGLSGGTENARRRFSIAHEGAHDVLHRHIPLQTSPAAVFHSEFDADTEYDPDLLREMLNISECFANRAAACFLMPEFLVRRVLKRHNGSRKVIIYDNNILSQDQNSNCWKDLRSMCTEMTSKMQMLYEDIIASLGQLPPEKRIYVFGDDENVDMDWVIAVANYITLEFIKYSYDYNDPVYPLRHFLRDADDSERMLQSRTVQYVLKYKKQEMERVPDIPPDYKFAIIDMDTMEKKLKGYRFTEMNFFEHQIIHDIEVIKAIVEKRIGSSKKVPNPRFEEMFEQYDRMVEGLIDRSCKSDHDMVFSSLALFTLEWNFAIETLYHVACLMEENKLEGVDLKTLVLLVGRVWIESQFGGSVMTDSRMVKERRYILDYLFDDKTDRYSQKAMTDLIKEILVIGVYYREVLKTDEGELYKEWFRKQSTVEDWASFFRYYNIFDIWQKKEWTRKRIRNMRLLVDRVTRSKE